MHVVTTALGTSAGFGSKDDFLTQGARYTHCFMLIHLLVHLLVGQLLCHDFFQRSIQVKNSECRERFEPIFLYLR